MKIRVGEDIKAGTMLRTALDLNGSEYILVRVRPADPYGFPPQFIAGRDIRAGEWIDMDTEEGKTVMVTGAVTNMVAGEDIEPGWLVYLSSDGKVRPMPQELLSQVDIALAAALPPDLVQRIARNLSLSETIRLMGLVKPDQDES